MSDTTVTAEPAPRSPRFPSSKFRAPKLAPGLVRRSRLLDQLDGGEQVRLAMVVGPAGAGKTMLLADWLAAHPEREAIARTCEVNICCCTALGSIWCAAYSAVICIITLSASA